MLNTPEIEQTGTSPIEHTQYSFTYNGTPMQSEGSTSDTVTVDGNSEFFQAISGRKSADMWAVMGGTHGHAPSYQPSTVQLRFAKNKFLTAPEMCAIMAMQMESSICTHSEYVTAKGTGGFTVRFLFYFFQKTFQKSVDKQRTRRYNVIEPKR